MGTGKRYLHLTLSAAFLIGMLAGGPFILLALSAQARASGSAAGTELPPSFQQRAQASLAAGKFLVAGRNIRDSLFAEAVILLVDYGPQGAMGLVVNRPTDVKLPDVLPNVKGAKQREDKVYIGGPVGIDQIFLLIRAGADPGESLHVFGRVYVSTSEKVLEKMLARPGKGDKFLLCAGYSGWAAGQLEREVLRGDWHVMDADEQSIFDKKPSAVWPDLIERASGQWVNAAAGGHSSL